MGVIYILSTYILIIHYFWGGYNQILIKMRCIPLFFIGYVKNKYTFGMLIQNKNYAKFFIYQPIKRCRRK